MIILILLVLIILSAWFSGMEIALFSLSSAKLRQLLLEKKTNAIVLQRILSRKNRLLVTILLGNNLVNIGAASLATVWALNYFGSSGAGIATGVMTGLILVFGEMYPKAYFQIHAAEISLRFARTVYIIQLIFYPVIIVLEKFLFWLTRGKSREKVSETEFRALSRLAVERGVLEFEEHQMIMNVLSFDDRPIKEIMTSRYKMIVLNDDADVDQVAYFMAHEGFSRYPVYHNQEDNIIGYVHVSDILAVLNSKNREDSLEKHLKPILVFNENEKINIAFNQMRRQRSHIAIVKRKDQLLGLVTIEDILESLVGDIKDERDK